MNFLDLEYRMHIARSYEDLEVLMDEANSYFENSILNVSQPAGFFYNYKWTREYNKKVAILVGHSVSEFALVSLGYRPLTLNEKQITFTPNG